MITASGLTAGSGWGLKTLFAGVLPWELNALCDLSQGGGGGTPSFFACGCKPRGQGCWSLLAGGLGPGQPRNDDDNPIKARTRNDDENQNRAEGSPQAGPSTPAPTAGHGRSKKRGGTPADAIDGNVNEHLIPKGVPPQNVSLNPSLCQPSAPKPPKRSGSSPPPPSTADGYEPPTLPRPKSVPASRPRPVEPASRP